MSDVKRYNCRIPADSLLGANPYQQVVLASDFDALAQRCRELEASLQRAQSAKAESDRHAGSESDALRAENVRLAEWYSEAGVREDALRAERDQARRTAEHWKAEHLAGNAVIDQLRAEVERLRGVCVDLDSEKREIEHKMDAYRTSHAEVEALRKAMEWISVEDKLPEKGRYLVSADSDDGQDVCEMSFNGKDWIYEGEPTYCHSFYVEVTHWMERPAPAMAAKDGV